MTENPDQFFVGRQADPLVAEAVNAWFARQRPADNSTLGYLGVGRRDGTPLLKQQD